MQDEEQIKIERDRHSQLDEARIRSAKAILARHAVALIREKSLSNLDRWKARGVWISAYDEWQEVLINGRDEDLIHTMTSTDERCAWLRKSPPYPDLIREIAT